MNRIKLYAMFYQTLLFFIFSVDPFVAPRVPWIFLQSTVYAEPGCDILSLTLSSH